MIFTERTVTVTNDNATINRPLILYRGDKNIELKITIAESQFKFRNTDASNVIETTDASYAQLVINTPYGSPIFSDVAATKNGAVIFVITEGMIDEIRELGSYSIQIRLLDDDKQSRATIPPVSNAIEIKAPIAIEDGSAIDGNTVNTAMAGYAVTTYSTPLESFDSQGNYIKTTWGEGDVITDARLNKIEAGIDGVNQKVASGGAGGTGLTAEQSQQLNTAYTHSQSTHVQASDIPTKTSDLTNDSDYATQAYVTNKVAEAQLGGSEATLSLYQTKADNTLATTNKTVSGAINEVKASVDAIDSVIIDYTGGKKQVYLTQSEYDLLTDVEKSDSTKVYNITDAQEQQIPADLTINNNNLLQLVGSDGNTIGTGVVISTSSGGTANDVVLTSSNGTQYKLGVSDDGVLSVQALGTTIQYGNIVISATSLNVNEGENTVFTVNLDKSPTNNQVINIVSNNENITVSPNNLTFTSSNYVTGQTVTISTTKDGLYTDYTGTITLSSDNVDNKTVTINVTNTETNGEIQNPTYTNYAYNTDTFSNPNTSNHPNKGTYYLAYNSTKSITDGILTVTKKPGVASGTAAYFLCKLNTGDNNTYYYRVLVRTNYNGVALIGQGPNVNIEGNGQWQLISYILTDTSSSSGNMEISMDALNELESIEIKEIMKINLTEIYGSGQEPDKATCDTIFTTYVPGLEG